MRPSWHKDLKWLFGLICLIAVLVAAATYSLRSLTAQEPATGIFSAIMTSFAKEGDGEESWPDMQAQAAEHPDEEFTIEGVTLPVKGNEIAGLSYDEAVDLVVGRIADELYVEGPHAVEEYFQSEATAEEGSSEGDEGGSGDQSEEFGLGPFGLLTRGTHDTLHDVFTIAAAVAVVTMIPLAFFSRRFGRLGSPGVVVALGTAPLTLVWFAVHKATAGEGGSDDLGASLATAVGPTAADVSERFLTVFLLGVAMIGVAILGNVGLALWRRLRRGRAEKPSVEAAEPSPDWDEYPLIERGLPFPV